MPDGASPLLFLSAVELARRIRSRESSSAEVVDAHIARIEAVNGTLNAVVADRFVAARQEAKDADARVAASRDPTTLPPLLGVPCTIKESIAVAGMPNSAGLVSRARWIADEDAPPVARLRAAGAVVLGVTNTSEITCFPGASNRVYGATANAHDESRTPGGSSGGEGAIVGAGGSPFGIGTDIGGSIRIPAFCNGVFGHKPSGGLVPSSGQYPLYSGGLQSINATGPLARRAEDLMPVLRILAGPDGRDDTCVPIALGDPEKVQVSKLRVIVASPNQKGPRVSSELAIAQQRAAYALAGRGADVEMRALAGLRPGAMLAAGRFFEAGPMQLARVLGEGRPVPLVRELLRAAAGRSRHTTPALTMGLLEQLGGLIRKRLLGYAERASALRDELDALLAEDGVLLTPAARDVAPPRRAELASGAPFSYCAVWNALELPVTEVPLGRGRSGLPLGVQVVATHGQDHLCIAVARALQESDGGWVVPEDLAGERA